MKHRSTLFVLVLVAVLLGAWFVTRASEGERRVSDQPTPIGTTTVELPTVAETDEPVGEAAERVAQIATVPSAEVLPEAPRFRITGTVRDLRGNPVAHTTVVLNARRDPTLESDEGWRALKALDRDERYRSMRVESDGTYAFDGIAPGYYGIGIYTASSKPEQEVDLELRGDRVCDFQLEGFLELSGSVERPRPSTVRLGLEQGRSSSNSILYSTGNVRALKLTDDDSFRFTGLSPGFYRVRAESPELALATFEFDLRESVHDAHLVLEQGFVFAGRIEADFETEAPSFYVSLERAERGDDSGWTSDGTFRVTNLRRQTYPLRLEAKLPGRRKRRVERSLFIDVERDVTDFHYVIHGDIAVTMSVDVPPGAPVVEGTLTATSDDGVTVQTRRVRVGRATGATTYWRGGVSLYSFRWSETPLLELPPISAGRWTVRLELIGYRPWERAFELEDGQTLEAKLDPLPGRIVEADYPLAYYSVEQRPAGSTSPWDRIVYYDARNLSSHGDPLRTAQARLPVGVYDLRVMSDQNAPLLIENVRIEDDLAPLVIDAELAPGRTIAGRIEGPTGNPQRTPLHLWMRTTGAWERLEAKTHFYGSDFAFAGLAPGTYRATFDRNGNVPAAEWKLGETDLRDRLVVLGGE